MNVPFSDWITFLEYSWDIRLDIDTGPSFPVSDENHVNLRPIKFPVEYMFCACMCTVLPSPPWVDCHAPGFQDDMIRSPTGQPCRTTLT